MKYLIVGLGNIGQEYEQTRHNIGFDVVDILAKDLNAEFDLQRHAFIAKAKLKGRTLVIIKPTTYMNLSGKAVKYWMNQENIKVENVLVICDDLALPLGKLRMKLKGGDGNHNGLSSIIENIGHNKFSRLRYGIGNDFKRGYQSDFVLGKWKTEEIAIIEQKNDVAVDMIKSFCTIGPERTMTAFNNKS
jgi:PTH1 family peptidyl-tRNA hydrolase